MQCINPSYTLSVEWFFSIVTVNRLLNPTPFFKQTPFRQRHLHSRPVLYVLRLVHEAQVSPIASLANTRLLRLPCDDPKLRRSTLRIHCTGRGYDKIQLI